MPAGTKVSAGSKARTTSIAQAYLPWWALALAVAIFTAFFALLSSPASADPGAGAAGAGAVDHVVAFVQLALGRLAA
ncbi:hypothetical protein B7P34_34880 [Streptosporangium nondiastaticum]|uniref:Uncharacterized protein n=1 Tax=Streptosporangium nondiastaticum TaxID=35764 RepID=A0A9X7PDU5_9ACTN|nr:hypothetical protein [Streptosporangium nondiastaticum]PSJ24161.1 hypothetical protein B7P34_34880 [Streptosporangium nondiastaticum]